MLTLLPKGVKKKVKMFLIEDFFDFPPASTNTGGVHLELWISPGIFKNIWNGPNGVVRSLGETDSWKKPEVKNLLEEEEKKSYM
jgi:hypothetical protein